MQKKQYHFIKFPFQNESGENYLFDLNQNTLDEAKSQIIHVIFTPKGSKLRDPEFGTNLMHYIFNPSFEDTWENVKREITDAISRYVNNVNISNISILQDEENIQNIYVKVSYIVSDNNRTIEDSIVTKI